MVEGRADSASILFKGYLKSWEVFFVELEEQEEKTETVSMETGGKFSNLGENDFENMDRLHRLYQELYEEFVKSMKSEKFFSVQKDNQEQLGH